MKLHAVKDVGPALIVGVGLMTSSIAYAQVAISEDGVTFPDDSEQYTGVPNDCPHSESIVWDTNAERWVCHSELSPIAYNIGDTGPAGGTVFWTTEDGLQGLEAAPYDQGTSPWGCEGLVTGATRTGVLAGDENTADILVACGETVIAARLADNYSLNGFDDWHLPSKNELHFLYVQRAVVGGFARGYYWSSSEGNGSDAWYQGFGSGDQYVGGKGGTYRVRAVRAF